jgi:ATP phosphoribosyltransferase regulatory subunit
MAGRSSSEREALALRNAAVMAVFARAGFDHIEPDIIQPADIFLERSGEDIRTRTFVFSDPSGTELCLRPDLTVPACRYHLSHAADPKQEARYCYLGPAFRYSAGQRKAEELTQAGLEWFGGGNPATEDARVLKLAVGALEAAGATGLKVTLGDLGLFSCLLDDMTMPERWRRRLKHQFWRPQAFRELLDRFSDGIEARRSSISATVDAIGASDALTVAHQAIKDLPLVGGRSIEEIAERLAEKHADRSERALAPKMKQAIETYLAIEGKMMEALPALKAVGHGAHYSAGLQAFEQRIAAFEDQGLNPRRFEFSAIFGRELEYYTGFVFQIEAQTAHGPVMLAGGGRYDDLLGDMGAPATVPAVGCAIFTENLTGLA